MIGDGPLRGTLMSLSQKLALNDYVLFLGSRQDARKLVSGCDLFVSIGTSGVVYPAAQMPQIAHQQGIPTVEINLEDTPLSHLFRYTMRGKASDMLRELKNE